MPKRKIPIEEREMKVFYPSWMEDLPFPEMLSYKNLIVKPEELKDINEVEGIKLAGIEEGAMNLANHTSDDLPEGVTNKYDDQAASSKANAGLTAEGFVKKVIQGSNLTGTPTVGVNVTNTYIGYYNGTTWPVYIKNDGKFMFQGNSGNYITWDGTTLNIRGQLNADDITAGTLTGRTVRTAESGARVVIGGQADWIKFYDLTSEQAMLFASNGDFLIKGQQTNSDIFIVSGSSGSISFFRGGAYRGQIDSNFVIDVPTAVYLKLGGESRFILGSTGAELGGGTGAIQNVKIWAGSAGNLRQVNLLSGGYAYPSLEPFVGPLDLGNPDYKWRNLYLSGSIFTYGGYLYYGTTLIMDMYSTYISFPNSDFQFKDGVKLYPVGRSAYPAIKLTAIGGNYTRADCRTDFVPDTDGEGQLGYDNKRWYRIRGIDIKSGDYWFENKFRFTEEGKNAIALYNPKGKKILIIDNKGNIKKVIN